MQSDAIRLPQKKERVKVVKARHLTHLSGSTTPALKDVNFTIQPETVAVVGTNRLWKIKL